ncbi:unnamed protein product [Pleuronectes platessa]|uniref:DUF1736 domain-containing protein n=1 Tax=Pleuronectes platessa TaxID=8262 RepID=A0A9N7UJN6_PLEPL|nr:unnamed protein product [Pleuronectes platessa]
MDEYVPGETRLLCGWELGKLHRLHNTHVFVDLLCPSVRPERSNSPLLEEEEEEEEEDDGDPFILSVQMQRKNVHLLLNVFLLAGWGAVLLAGRFYWMGNKPPNFSNSDNPAADSPSLLSRTLTFFHLPAANFWLLLCPTCSALIGRWTPCL